VDRVVLPVGARDADQDRRPAQQTETAFGLELALEEQHAPHHLVIDALRLRDTVDEDLEGSRHVDGERGKRSPAHLAGHVHRMHPPVRKLPPVAVGVAIVLAVLAAALGLPDAATAGNGGISPVTPHSPNAGDITDAWWFITGFILFVFVVVEGLLLAF